MKAGVEFATPRVAQKSGAPASPGSWLAMQRSGPAPHRLNHNLHTHETPRQFPYTLKVWKHWVRVYSRVLLDTYYHHDLEEEAISEAALLS